MTDDDMTTPASFTLTRTLEAGRAAGLERAVLDVDSESPTGAVGLYERLGFTTAKQSVVLERAW